MSRIISVYSRNAYKEFRLPKGDNRECSIILSRKDFDLAENVRIPLKVTDGEVSLDYCDGNGYEIADKEKTAGGNMLIPGKAVKIVTADGNKFILTREEQPDEAEGYIRLDISDKDMITIGRGDECDIRYDHFGIVSRKHAVLKRTGYDWKAESLSKNGIYVNGEHVLGEVKLFHGDHLNIMGLHLIFLGEALALYDALRSAVISGIPVTSWSEPNKLVPGTVPDAEDPGAVRIRIEQPVVGATDWKATYEEYLDLKEKEIKEAVRRRALYLESAYPSSGEYLEESWFGERSCGRGQLPFWHRHAGDPELLKVRIGRTDVRDLIKIDFDEEKLYLTDKALSDRAKRMLAGYRTVEDLPLTADLDGKTVVWIGENPERSETTADDLIIQLAAHIPPSELRIKVLSDKETGCMPSWETLKMLPHICSDNMAELSKILIRREGMTAGEIEREVRYILLLNDISAVKGSVFERYIKQGKYLGFTLIVPDGNGSFMAGSGRTESELRFPPRIENFRHDDLDTDILEVLVKRMRATGEGREADLGALPENVKLVETAEIKNAQPEDIIARWNEHRTYEHIKCVLGMGAGGAARYLDLHERYNGPHVLAAGMTGSGKSELLKTIVLSLAMEYSPEDINFVLIDFKGGSMANSLAAIPHSAGSITNLSGGEIERAVLAVKDEIKERQIRLADAGTSHIDDYVRMREAGKAERPMPHLIIVIDEFAELKKEKPDLMAELISIAQTGRSLGIHLILATQRPQGNVDDNIRSNVRTDICLRVQDRKDSEDVIGRPDAAFVSDPGRAYIRMGEDELFDEFQTALAGADEAYIKTLIASASERAGMKANKLWLDPLAKEIHLEDVLEIVKQRNSSGAEKRKSSGANEADAVSITAGMVDDPERRSRYPLVLDLPEAGNIAIVGMPASGKTTLLHTMISSLRDTDTEIYMLDLDSEDLLDDISEEIAERKSSGTDRPNIVVAVDGYENLRDTFGYSGEKKIADMMREAEGAGVTFIITGGGFGLGQITGGAEKTVKTILCLRQRNIYEYMDTLHTKDITRIPDSEVKGRGLTLIEGRAVEFQTAVCPENEWGGEDR